MSFESLLAFAAAMFVLALSPGPGVAAVVGRALQAGVAQAMMVTLGLIVGDILYMSAAVAGWAAVAAQLGAVFTLVRLAGAAYLIYLGYKTWKSADQPLAIGARPGASSAGSFSLGLAVTLGNPKAILFYLSFMPTFMDLRSITLTGVVEIACVIAAVSLIVLGAYATLAVRGSARLNASPAIARRLRKTTGGLLIGAGAAVAIKAN
jgi:threonine/homoserine/homoserine lactone efflux protein